MWTRVDEFMREGEKAETGGGSRQVRGEYEEYGYRGIKYAMIRALIMTTEKVYKRMVNATRVGELCEEDRICG